MPEPQASLTTRQAELFQWLFEDLSMKEIGFRMGIHPQTAQMYARKVYQKHGVNSRLALILKVLRTANERQPVPQAPAGGNGQ